MWTLLSLPRVRNRFFTQSHWSIVDFELTYLAVSVLSHEIVDQLPHEEDHGFIEIFIGNEESLHSETIFGRELIQQYSETC